MIIKKRSYARAGLLGNPSDGYFGKTVSFSFRNFWAEVTLYETPKMEFIPSDVDDASFANIDELIHEIELFGYYGGIRLLKAMTKLFFLHCRNQGITLPSKNFTVSYESNIPRLVGLSGSSAIVTAHLKALQEFYGVSLPLEFQPTLALQAERSELGIQCGLQDRVIQTYDGLMFMDFRKELIETRGFGLYERLVREGMPRLYIAYDPDRAEVSGVYHQKLRVLFDEKKPDILAAMSEFADFAQQGRDAIVTGRFERLPGLMNANFDLRNRIFNVAEGNRNMVMTARSTGCSSKFAGSGGAIVGICEDEEQYVRLVEVMRGIGCTTIRPELTEAAE